MSDLIRRGDVLDALIEKGQKSKRYKWGDRWELNLFEIKEVVESVPSAEPERKTGRWTDGMLYYDFDESEWEKVKCSVCENFVTKQIFYHDNKYHYCPYCGADMKGEHE